MNALIPFLYVRIFRKDSKALIGLLGIISLIGIIFISLASINLQGQIDFDNIRIGTNTTFRSTNSGDQFQTNLDAKTTDKYVHRSETNGLGGGGSASVPSIWTNQVNLSQVLTFSTNITWDMNNGQIAWIICTNNTTTNFYLNVTNQTRGSYFLHIVQSSTGNASNLWSSNFKWRAGATNNGTTNASAHDCYSWISDGTNMWPGGFDLK